MGSPYFDPGVAPLRRSNRTLKALLNNAHQQNQSAFFQRLPAELRLIIYAFVFPSHAVHIMTYNERKCRISNGLSTLRLPELMGLQCKLELEDVPYTPGIAPCFDTLRCHEVNVSNVPCDERLNIGGLLRACRLLHVESVSLLYTNTSFVFNRGYNLSVFCQAISLNRQFAPRPLMFIRDIRIGVLGPDLQYIRDTNAGLTVLTEQAVNLKRFELAVQESRMRGQDTRANIWSGARGRLLKKTWRILGSLRGLESFDLYLLSSLHAKHLTDGYEASVVAMILRELVTQPKSSRAMTDRQFRYHFKTRYQALMTTEEMEL